MESYFICGIKLQGNKSTQNVKKDYASKRKKIG